MDIAQKLEIRNEKLETGNATIAVAFTRLFTYPTPAEFRLTLRKP